MVKAKPSLGNIVRHIRNSNGWTLAEMSQRVAIPLSTLAKVEKGHLTLTYDKLVDLSDKLGMGLSDFLNSSAVTAQPKGMARRSVGKTAADGLNVETQNYDYRYLCTELRGKIMIPIISRVRSKTMQEFGELLRHAGEEFVYVLEGAIEVHSEFYDPITLRAGEYVYLDSEMGHGYLVADGCEEATILAVCASAAANLQQELISQARGEAPKTTKLAVAGNAEKPKALKSSTHKNSSAKPKRRAGAA
ncbi:transcriptional regulator [Steroidobacter agaridevorans]|uniref:Transcriptional regulator n=1 Tax=Steroidobacter agaridevorans TaxID=2695856 RepID=A0A829Y9T0_9GAMM|nr:XRE family transcriptional regulator [Steroidobacter agaridevorans]GFE79920.1 transcriptional regulator [Steroidobacter agaridevorans]